MKKISIVVMIIFLNSLFAFAEENYCSVGVNADSFMGMEVGYGRGPEMQKGDVAAYIKVNIPLFLTMKQRKIDTIELTGGIQSCLVTTERFALLGGVEANLLRHKDILGTSYPLGMGIKLTPAYKYKGQYIGVLGEYKKTMAVYMKHSEVAKERFGDMVTKDGTEYKSVPDDGWMISGGGVLNIGVEGLTGAGGDNKVYYKLGMTNFQSKLTDGFDAVMFGQLPFFFTLQLNAESE